MRPKKTEEEKRTHRKSVNFTAKELKTINKKAERLGMSVSEYLRTAALNVKIIQPDVDYAKFIAVIAKIGSNLNQVAKSLNQGHNFEKSHEMTLNELKIAFEEIKQMIINPPKNEDEQL